MSTLVTREYRSSALIKSILVTSIGRQIGWQILAIDT